MKENCMPKPVELFIVGAGQRGQGYARYALDHSHKARVAAVAEPNDHYRDLIARQHRIPPQNVFKDWREAVGRGRLADAAVISTQDAMHKEPAIYFAQQRYHVLLEKPMATTRADCRSIVGAADTYDIVFAVAHVLRYTPYTRQLKQVIDSGRIGDVVSIQRLEPVGYWHYAHSYVRGNWHKESESTFMLMAKSCHDLDWIRYMAGAKCKTVSSFGSLKHFVRKNKPAGAAERCLDCAVEDQCPYSAKKIYLSMFHAGHREWPVSYLTSDLTVEGLMRALRNGPYGRCVYECDNDVVDHQVVNLQFENDITASFTMTAFTHFGHRQDKIFGTRGEITGDGSTIDIYDFVTDCHHIIDTHASDGGIFGGHGGGDKGLMDSFVDAIATGDRTSILSGPAETLETHLMVFAAEEARRQNKVITLPGHGGRHIQNIAAAVKEKTAMQTSVRG